MEAGGDVPDIMTLRDGRAVHIPDRDVPGGGAPEDVAASVKIEVGDTGDVPVGWYRAEIEGLLDRAAALHLPEPIAPEVSRHSRSALPSSSKSPVPTMLKLVGAAPSVCPAVTLWPFRSQVETPPPVSRQRMLLVWSKLKSSGWGIL